MERSRAGVRRWWESGRGPWTLLAVGLLAAAALSGQLNATLRVMLSDPPELVAFLAAAVIAVTIHELAHARAAVSLGDDTVAPARLSIDPRRQIDLLGFATIVVSTGGMGYGRPVLVDETKVAPGQRVLVALAGPLANIALAAAASVPLNLHVPNAREFPYSDFFRQFLAFNCVNAFFNLLPIPPLDGAAIVQALLPPRLAPFWKSLGIVGPLMVVLVVLRGQVITDALVIEPAHSVIRTLLQPIVAP